MPAPNTLKLNASLKKIAALCGSTELMTFHPARRAFATTISLLSAVPKDGIPKMLVYTNFRTTQHFAMVLDIKVGEHMRLQREKLKDQGH